MWPHLTRHDNESVLNLCIIGKVGEAVASFLDEEILWIGDDWCTSNPCPAGAYILETGHPVLQFPDDKQMLEMNQNFVDYHLCCINQNDTQYEEQCYSIVDRCKSSYLILQY